MTDNKNSLTDANSAEGVPLTGATPSSSADSAQRADSDATLTQTADEIAEARELSARGSQPPSEVDGYSFIRQIGEGAYGAVWLAREDNTGKQVAIKFYTHRRGLDWSLLNREVEKLAVLYTSRNIIGLLDVGWDNDPPYYVMEYLENGSLASYLAEGPLPVNEAVRITRLIAQALVQAHGAGILHCDLKPANVLLDSDFEPRLCDFGQSRLSNEQDPALGTLFYMAREQADLQAIPDARWDVYALGALMYKMLTGEPPHGTPENHAHIREAGSLEDRLTSYQNVLSSGPPPEKHRKVSGVDRRLADIISRCIQVDPQKRYPNAQAVLDRLEYRDRQRARRPLMLLGIVGPGLLLAAMAPIFFDAMASNVATLEEQLTNRALESDAVVASSQAHTLEVELALRGVELIEAANAIGQSLGNDADFARLRALVKSRERERFLEIYFDYYKLPESRQPAWLVGLNREKHNGDKRLTKLDRGADTSWFLTDKLGFQMWRSPWLDKAGQPRTSLGKNYAWRDYFHGEGADKQPGIDPTTVTPFGLHENDQREWYMSAPFVSEATGRNMVAITAPVFSPDREFLGMLGRTIHLFELLSKLGTNLPHDVDRGFALAEEREWRLLDHSWIPNQSDEWDTMLKEIGVGSTEFFDRLQLDDAVKTRIRTESGKDVRFPDYNDPIGSVNHPGAKKFADYSLAAFAEVKVGDTNWWVIVQESKTAAHKPVKEMTYKAKWYGWLAFLVVVPIIGLLWFLVSRALNVRSLQQWPQKGESGSRLTGISTH